MRLTHGQRVLAAAGLGRNEIIAGADAADRLAVGPEQGLVAGILQSRRAVEP